MSSIEWIDIHEDLSVLMLSVGDVKRTMYLHNDRACGPSACSYTTTYGSTRHTFLATSLERAKELAELQLFKELGVEVVAINNLYASLMEHIGG